MIRTVAPKRCRKSSAPVMPSCLRRADAPAEVLDGGAQAFFELHGGLPAQLALRARIVERDAVHVAAAARPMLRLLRVIGEDRELAEKIVDRYGVPAADVIRAVGAA